MKIIDLETMVILDKHPGYLTGVGGHINLMIVVSSDSIAFCC